MRPGLTRARDQRRAHPRPVRRRRTLRPLLQRGESPVYFQGRRHVRTADGWVLLQYPPATSVLRSLTFGRIAGLAAANEL